jgi:leucyl-tRNA synthetase
MSKSLGNVINPDEVVKQYGADTLRLFEMFLGPLADAKPWDTKGILGIQRFLDRVYRLVEGEIVRQDVSADPALTAQLHRTVKKVTDDIEKLHFNTAIAAMMEFTNAVYKKGELPQAEAEVFLKLLSPFAPHLAEHLWHELGHETSIGMQEWPVADERLLKDETVVIAIQVNGKVRDKIVVASDADEAAVKTAALASGKVQKHIADKEIQKVVYVPGRVMNLMV